VATALAPALIFSAYANRAKGDLWFGFSLGGAGWLGALIARIAPLYAPLALYGVEFARTMVYACYAAVLAGVFEEPIRYFCVRKVSLVRRSLRHTLSFGLGWGFIEALLIYGLPVAALEIMGMPKTLEQLLPGAVERNLAVASHVAMTFIVLCALLNAALLLLAVALHAGLNAAAVLTLMLTGDVWLTESVALVFAFATVVIALASLRKYRAALAQKLGAPREMR